MKNTLNQWSEIISKEAYKSKGMNWLKEIDNNLMENPSNLAQILLLMQEWKWKYHFEDVPDQKIAEAVTFYKTLNEQERADLKEWIESVLRVIVEEKWIEKLKKEIESSKLENKKEVEKLIAELNNKSENFS